MKNSTIKPKESRCKGTGLAQGHGCGKLTLHRIYGLGKMCCYSDWLLNSENGRIKLERATLKVKTVAKTEQKKADKKTRESLLTLGYYEKEAKRVFQKFIRLRDEGLNCVSCGTPKAKEWHASHYFDCNKFSGLIFDENNCHKSCDYCNVFLHGNLLEYRKGIISRFGDQYLNEIESRSDNARMYKYTKDELIKIKEKYLSKIKEML